MQALSTQKLRRFRMQQWHFFRGSRNIITWINSDEPIVYGAFSTPIDRQKATDLNQYAELHPAKGDSRYIPWTYVVCQNPLSEQLIYDYKLTRII